jgi:NADH:ubiquinone oxidoreductase subunit 5 (subunit L)/multisubunit Na+/H+ antiporter MnhA subunit
LVIPAFGIVSTTISAASNKSIFGYLGMVYAITFIGILGFKYMVITVGLSSYNVALFYLVNHAFRKGLLFLAAGSVIHAVGDNQDFRKYGGLRLFLSLTRSVMVIASISLVAFLFMIESPFIEFSLFNI